MRFQKSFCWEDNKWRKKQQKWLRWLLWQHWYSVHGRLCRIVKAVAVWYELHNVRGMPEKHSWTCKGERKLYRKRFLLEKKHSNRRCWHLYFCIKLKMMWVIGTRIFLRACFELENYSHRRYPSSLERKQIFLWRWESLITIRIRVCNNATQVKHLPKNVTILVGD